MSSASNNIKAKPATGKRSAGNRKNVKFPIIGVGASAGGLETYTELLKSLPVNTGMAFVLVQHLDPKHASILAELLVKATKMPVIEVRDGMLAKPNHVYVIPPNTDMAILHGYLELLPRSTSNLPMPIDYFFRSLVQDQGSKAIGVVLSGTGSDGAQGLAAIKAAGGITFAQEPETAKYDGMPHAAIASGGADLILSPKGIASELARIGRHPFIARFSETEPAPIAEEELLRKIFILLRNATGTDFTYYKHATIKRRIARRMVLLKMERLADYVKYLQEHPDEAQLLYDDILITVTEFFREPEVFEALNKEVLPKIIKDKGAEKPIRAWVAGCATGEEAYSVAISLIEFFEVQAVKPPIQIFATDVHEKSIEKARNGIYSESAVSHISSPRLRRFFTQVEGGYQVNRIIREMCVFASHDVTKDPPFSRLDLISCRNLLIYLGTVLQKKVIPMFHWALNTKGFLMLGASETVGQFSSLFEPLDTRNKIFERKSVPAKLPVEFGSPEFVAPQPEPFIQKSQWGFKKAEFDLQKEADRLVLDKYGPAGIVIDENMTIIHFRGHTSPYLEPTPGKASLNLMDMARPGLKLDLRTAVFQTKKTNAATIKEHVKIKHNGRYREINIEVSPIKTPTGTRYFLVLFKDVADLLEANTLAQRKKAKPRLEEEQEVEQLKKELIDTKEYLQSMIEERDVTNEELRAANEELQSNTEELQSINEELETAKEELQSSNEELTTVNEELQNRNRELSQTNNDLTNLLTSATIPIVMVGGDLRIRRLTTQAEKVLNIRSDDIGRPITDIKLKIDISEFEQMIGSVIDTITPMQKEVQDIGGYWYLMQIRAYLTHEKKIDGAVISLLDIDALKRNEREVKAARDFARSIVETVREPLIVLDRELRILSANNSFYEVFQVSRKQTENRPIYEIGNRQWDIPALRELLEELLAQNTEVEGFEVDHSFSQIGHRIMLLNARRMTYETGTGEMVLLAIEDITERKKAQDGLAREKDKAENYIDIAGVMLMAINTEQEVILVNKKGCEVLGYSKNEIIGKNWYDNFLPARVRDEVRRVGAKLLAGDIQPVEYFENSILTKSGEERTIAFHNTVLRDENGKIVAHLSSGEDITERKLRELLNDELNEINTTINSTLDNISIIPTVVSRALKAIECDSSSIVLLEEGDWVARYVSGLPKKLIGTRFTDEQAKHFALVRRTKTPIFVADTRIDERVDRRLMEEAGIRSFMLLPIIAREEVVGAVAFHYLSAPIAFGPIQIDFAKKLVTSIGFALENARLYKEEKQAKQLSDTLHEIDAIAMSTPDFNEITEKIIAKASKAVGCDAGSIVHKENSDWVTKNTYGQSRKIIGAIFSEQQFLEISRDLTEGPIIVSGASSDKRIFPEMTEEIKARSVLITPLIIGEEFIGAFVFNFSSSDLISDIVIDFAKSLARSIAMTVINTRLYAQQQNIVDTLQKSLLSVPEKTEKIDFGHIYRSSTTQLGEVGGDFYDVFEVAEDRVGIIVGDVAGKGIKAASITSMIKNSIKAYAFNGYSSATIIQKTNDIMNRMTGDDMFATVFFAFLNKDSGELLYCSAGHPPSLVRRTTGKVSLIATGSPAVGAFADVEFVEGKKTLEKGDTLIVYTDGVTEARLGKKLFGDERLIKFVRNSKELHATELPSKILEEVESFSGGKLADDIAILAISRI